MNTLSLLAVAVAVVASQLQELAVVVARVDIGQLLDIH